MRGRTITKILADRVTRGAALVVGLAGVTILLVHSAVHGDLTHLLAAGVFGATQTLLFVATALYPSFRVPQVKHVIRVFDKSCVFLVIAGTSTAFSLCAFSSGLRWALFGLLWGLTFLGIVLRVLIGHWRYTASAMLAIFVGWAFLIAVEPFLVGLPHDGLWLLLLAGVAYTVGIVASTLRAVPQRKALWD